MKILFLAHRIPYPPDKGEKIRAFHELKFLGARHTVDLCCFADSEAEALQQAGLGDYCRRIYVETRSRATIATGAVRSFLRGQPLSCGFFFSGKFQSEVERSLATEEYDVVFVYCSSMAQYIPWPLQIPVVMDFVDIDSAKWKQYARRSRPPFSWVYAREARELALYEEKWARVSSSTMVTTQQEADLLRGEGIPPVHVVSNGVEIHPAKTAEFPAEIRALQPYALFVGTMDYLPNIDAVEYFAEDILPRVHEKHPELKFVIAGRNPTSRVRKLAKKPGVVVTGAVPEVETYLAGCAAVVAPFRIAQGIQNKVLEALAADKPIVSTPGPAAAIGAKHGETLLIAGNTEEFAKAVVALLEDPALYYRFSKGAEFVRKNFSWHENLSHLERLLLQAAGSCLATTR
ncbi:MAG TPA: TIGR03087 family PEP-CTERM/XrtA system glycosyltransferase [Candidatus Acidoferrum sp.]|jgi:sugar transferase (PEP-CTERM/EpsH1 system associated)